MNDRRRGRGLRGGTTEQAFNNISARARSKRRGPVKVDRFFQAHESKRSYPSMNARVSFRKRSRRAPLVLIAGAGRLLKAYAC